MLIRIIRSSVNHLCYIYVYSHYLLSGAPGVPEDQGRHGGRRGHAGDPGLEKIQL